MNLCVPFEVTVLITYDICFGRMSKKCFYINIKVGNVKVVKTLRFFSGSSSKTNVQHIWGCCLDFDPRHSADRNADSERVQQQLMQLKSLFLNTGKILKCKRKNCLCYCLL